ncbi:MAG: hypothetical protein LUH00_03015 [Lachnospiraceae bacterium]|nr:hypothetical protein [Lachnospiraceae bacterium]
MKRKEKIIAIAMAFTLAFTMNTSALAVSTQDVAIEDITGKTGVSHSEMYVMPGPEGQQSIGYLVTNNNDYDVSVGLNVEFRDESYVNIGSSSSFISCLSPGETELISAVNYYGETATYAYSYWLVVTSETTTVQPEGVTCSDMYSLTAPDGSQCVDYEIINNNSYDIYIGMNTAYYDESSELIGESSAYIPCLGAGNSTFIYTVNCYGESATYADTQWQVSSAELTSAAENVQISYTEQEDHLRASAVNLSSEAIWEPQVTVVYSYNSQPVVVYSGILTETSGIEGIDVGSGGFLNIDIPDGCDSYTAYSSAYYSIF